MGRQLNGIAKIDSTHLAADDWNSQMKDDLQPDLISSLKRQPGKNIVVFGGTLAQFLMSNGLIDEFHILTRPVALTNGKALFANLGQPLNLKLQDVERCDSGVVCHILYLGHCDGAAPKLCVAPGMMPL